MGSSQPDVYFVGMLADVEASKKTSHVLSALNQVPAAHRRLEINFGNDSSSLKGDILGFLHEQVIFHKNHHPDSPDENDSSLFRIFGKTLAS